MARRVSGVAAARLDETRLGLTMAVDDPSRKPARDPRLTAPAKTSSRADPVLAPIDQRPSKFDGPESRPSRRATNAARSDAALGGLPWGDDAPARRAADGLARGTAVGFGMPNGVWIITDPNGRLARCRVLWRDCNGSAPLTLSATNSINQAGVSIGEGVRGTEI